MTATVGAAPAPPGLIGEDDRTHHFGSVLSPRGRTLAHAYRLTNASAGTVRLADVLNRKTCCGVVKVGKTTLHPGESTEVSVTLSVGDKFGDVVHETEVITDPPAPSEIVLRTIARAVPLLRIEPLSADGLALVQTSGPRAVAFLVTANGTESEPALDLDAVALSASASIRWLGPKADADGEADAPASSRRFSVTLDPSGAPGSRSAAVLLRLGDREVGQHVVMWEVVPAIAANPKAIVLSASRRECRVVLASHDRAPFHITRVFCDTPGVTVTDSSEPNGKLPTITVTLQGDVPDQRPDHRIAIETDHPFAGRLSVPVVIQN